MKKFQLGYFLKLHHVEKAIEFMKLQLDQKSPSWRKSVTCADYLIALWAGLSKPKVKSEFGL